MITKKNIHNKHTETTMNQIVETVMNQTSALTNQTRSAPKKITRTVNSLCEKLSDEGIHIDIEDLQACLKKKKIVRDDGKLNQERFDMILKDFADSTSDEQLEQNELSLTAIPRRIHPIPSDLGS